MPEWTNERQSGQTPGNPPKLRDHETPENGASIPGCPHARMPARGDEERSSARTIQPQARRVKPDGSRPHARARSQSRAACSRRRVRRPRAARRGAAAEPRARDRALATRLAYGVVQRRATLDHVIVTLAAGRAAKLDPPCSRALRLGVLPARVPRPHARARCRRPSRSSSPSASSRAGAGLVNAVLRRAAREARALVDALPDATPAEAALRHSHPAWIAELWFDALGAGRGARPAGGRQRAGRGGRCAPTRCDRPPRTSREACRSSPRRRPLPEGLVLDGAVRRVASPL